MPGQLTGEDPCVSPACRTTRFLVSSRRSWRDGRLVDGLETATRAMHDGCGAQDTSCRVGAALVLSLLLAQVRRTHEAQAVLAAIDDTVQARANAEVTASATLARSGVALAGGHFEDAAELAASGLAEADRTGFRVWAPLGHFVLVQTALRRGHLSTAVRYTQKLKEDAVFQRELLPAGLAAWAVIQVVDLEQGHRSAAPLAAELLADSSAMRQLTTADPAALPWLVRLVTADGRPRAAASAVQIARQLAEENPHLDSLRATAWHATGLYEGDVALLRLAVRHHVDPWVRAAADEDIAALLSGRTGEPDTFHIPLPRTRDTATNGTPAGRGQPEWEIPELTDTEYDVATLVARGFTNGQTAGRLHLSPHTVAFHLRKIFRKLGVASRVQLASRWRELPGHHERGTRPAAGRGEPMRGAVIVR